MEIYLDVDGTIFEFAYPKIGRFNPNCFEVLIKLQESGHEIIINSVRCETNTTDGGSLDKVFSYLNYQPDYDLLVEIKLRTSKKHHPYPWPIGKELHSGLEQLYIDDIAYGIPLVDQVMTPGKMVNWYEVERQLTAAGIIQ